MAFKASQLPLQRGFERALDVAGQEKRALDSWAAQLNGTITGLDAVAMLANLDRVLAVFTEVAALPGMAEYAKTQFGSATYDVAAEFSAVISALAAVRSWLRTNIPANAVSISNGVMVGATYTPAQTAELKALVVAAAATIE